VGENRVVSFVQGSSHKQVTKHHHSVSFQNIKNLKYTSRREFNAGYQLWVSLWWLHCGIIYKHFRWRHCRRKYPIMNSILLFVFCGQKELALMPFALRSIQCMETSVIRD